jgi:hypothetical protein
MPAAAFGVHQLRYYLAYGSAAGAMLTRTGHSYLHSVVPRIVLLVAVAAGGFLGALGRAVARQRSLGRYTTSLLGLWLACTACLIAIFATQEFLEGLVATGHPAGVAGIFGYGGWWSIPAALCIGLVLAALFTARCGCSTKSRDATRDHSHTSRPASPRRSLPSTACSFGSRRWPKAAAVGVRLACVS